MKLVDLLKDENIFIAESYETPNKFYSDYSKFLKNNGIISNSEKVKRLFIKRENVQSTAIGKGAAAPHIFSDEFNDFLFSIAVMNDGMDYGAPDEGKVYLIFLIMSDERHVGKHLKSLAHIARLINSTNIVDSVKNLKNSQDIIKTLRQKEELI